MRASQPVTSTSSGPTSPMAHIVSTAKRLREVRKASRQFLLLWSIERGHSHAPKPVNDPDLALADPANHDWSLLYQGSVLDD